MKSEFGRLFLRYVIGFLSALLLSVGSYLIVVNGGLESSAIMAVILTLAVVQLIVQLIFFLHLDIRGRSAGRTVVFVFTIIMMLVVVVGSLWIMRNLDYRMGMSSEAMNEYMQTQNKKGF